LTDHGFKTLSASIGDKHLVGRQNLRRDRSGSRTLRLLGICSEGKPKNITTAQAACGFMPLFYHGLLKDASCADGPLDNHICPVHDHCVGQLSMDIYEQIVQLRRDGRRGAVATIVNVEVDTVIQDGEDAGAR